MKIFIKLIIVTLLVCISAQAADKVNILDANVTTYRHMLATLSKQKHSNSQTKLQILLLKTLLDLKQPLARNIKITYEVISSDQYANLFTQYLSILQRKIQDQVTADALSTKLKLLRNQIKLFSSKKDKLLTLQLQYAYYARVLKNNNIQIADSDKALLHIKDLLNKSIGNFVFNIYNIKEQSNFLKKRLLLFSHHIQQLEILKERYKLLGYKSDISQVTSKIIQDKKRYDRYMKQLIVNQFLDFSYLLSKKDHKASVLQSKIINNLKTLAYQDQVISAIEPMLEQMQREHLGGISYTMNIIAQNMKTVIKYAWDFMSYSIFTINGTGISLFKFVMAIIIFVAGFIIGGKYKRELKKVIFHKLDISVYARTIMANLGYYIILIITFFVSLNILGISLSSLALVAGALSVGIGFGLQNIVSNFVSGIILMFEKSIKVDDYVELADGTHGKIVDIRMRSTTLNTNDNIDITIPNQTFIQNNVINWTMNDNIRRFEIPFDVNYGQKPEFIIKIILEAVQKSGFKDVITTSTNFSRVIMTSLGDSSVNFSLFIWLKGEEIRHPKRTMSRFLILIYNTCYEYGVEISFPQRDLHIRSIDKGVAFPINLIKQPD